MDLLDLIGLGRRVAALLGTLLIIGWVFNVPGLHNFVQHVLDERLNQALDMFVPDR